MGVSFQHWDVWLEPNLSKAKKDEEEEQDGMRKRSAKHCGLLCSKRCPHVTIIPKALPFGSASWFDTLFSDPEVSISDWSN